MISLRRSIHENNKSSQVKSSQVLPCPAFSQSIPSSSKLPISRLLYNPNMTTPSSQVQHQHLPESLTHTTLRNNLLPQHPHKLRSTNALIRTILHKQRLRPQPQTGLPILANKVKRRDGNATTALTPVIAALLDNGTNALVHLRIDNRDRSLALLELVLVFGAEDIGDESGHGVAAEPHELSLAVVEEVETVGHEVGGSEVEGWRHHDCAGLGVGEAGVVGHVVQGVEAGVDVLHEEREREGREEAERGGAEVGGDLCGLAETKLGERLVLD
jgi:hypothetical protein